MKKQVNLFGEEEAIKKKKKEAIKIKKDYKAYIALWSGGKDSTVLADKLLRI